MIYCHSVHAVSLHAACIQHAPLLLLRLQVANPDGDLRLTVLNSSILERPRALALVPREG